MNKTLRLSFALKNTYRVNSILYALKQVPLLKRLLPDRLYQVRGFKIFANVLSVLWEIVGTFLGKLCYFLVMVALPSSVFDGMAANALFLHILFFLSLVGGLLNATLFDPSKDQYYAIILLRMNAKEYTLVNFFYQMGKTWLGFALFGMIFGSIAGLALWQCLLIPFFIVGLKITAAALELRIIQWTGNLLFPVSAGNWKLFVTLLLLGLAYGLPWLGTALAPQVVCYLMAVPVLTGILSLRELLHFDQYRSVHQQVQTQQLSALQQTKTIAQKQSQRQISNDTSISSGKSGMEFLNELFIKRHRKILWRPALRIAGICAAVVAALLVAIQAVPDAGRDIVELLMKKFPFFILLLYFINRGTGFTTALFMNCDHCLLTYSFYKQPRWLLRLFRIRLLEIIKINLLPALVIGLGLDLLLFAAGSAGEPLHYLVMPVSILCMSVFFSVHYLTLYYLLQPYNIGTEMKSATYQICVSVTYVVCYMLSFNLEIPALVFCGSAIAFCLLYAAVACGLVYLFSPKTFRLRT